MLVHSDCVDPGDCCPDACVLCGACEEAVLPAGVAETPIAALGTVEGKARRVLV